MAAVFKHSFNIDANDDEIMHYWSIKHAVPNVKLYYYAVANF